MRMKFEDLHQVLDQLPRRPLMVQVLTQCTASKLDCRASAEDLYTGMQHKALMEGVRQFRKMPGCNWCRIDVVSAKHGFVRGEDTLEPYEKTFMRQGLDKIRQMAEEARVPSSARSWWANALPDLKLVLLGNEYLEACRFPFHSTESQTIVLCSSSWAERIPEFRTNVSVVALGNDEAKKHAAGLLWLKGRLAAKLLRELGTDVRWSSHAAREAQ